MRNFSRPKVVETVLTPVCVNSLTNHGASHQCGYLSDISTDSEDGEEESDVEEHARSGSMLTGKLPVVRPLKRRKLEVSFRAQRQLDAAERKADKEKALEKIEKLLTSKKTIFAGGPHGLQVKRVRAIQSHLALVVQNGRNAIQASKMAAECHGFAAAWGGRQVRSWTRTWMSQGVLPSSLTGRHAKVYSLLDDPKIAMELRTYVRSNKWAVNPQKLVDFSKSKLIPAEAEKYLHGVVQDKMPQGVKRYMELELFPRIHLKVGKGISLATARRWLHREGFRYTSYKKGLYFDGHDRPDVVQYRQEIFLPKMKEYATRLVRYVVGNVEMEEDTKPANFVERRLVLASHDEMIIQANDMPNESWVLNDEHRMRKKGVGRGIHRSDVICSTVGHLVDAGQSLEYGKNHDGYWNGEMFVKQVRTPNFEPYDVLKFSMESQLKEKIIPTFERLHGPGFQALFLIDNSQGHSAYAEDALLATRMNVNPGGKQAKMRDGWFMKDGKKVSQAMKFPQDHPDYPNEPKGLKVVLSERGLYQSRLRGKCQSRCEPGATDCCNKRILECQPDFQAQRSLVQETIENAGHLCIFLPKFHCELNFIEFFWGKAKKYIRDNCDGTFETLKTNLPQAFESVQLSTIRLWEHRTHRWMDAYRAGLDTKAAQTQVQEFSSKKYKSHRRIPDGVAQSLDFQMQ